MDIYLPQLSDCDDPEEWLSAVFINYGIALRECRESGDKPGYAEVLRRLEATVTKAAKSGIEDDLAWVLLARHTKHPGRRLKYFLSAHKAMMRKLKEDQDEMNFDEAARERFEAATMLREIGLIYEAKGDLAKAEKFFTGALTHLREASDLMETFFLSEDNDNSEGEIFPLHPRLLKELERVKKRRA